MITFTCTTSRRLNLFLKMMDSFINCCKDIDLIEDFLIVDDRSPKNEIEEMKKYCAKNFMMATVFMGQNPGQASALNRIWILPKTEWILHVEDDWQFFKKGHFIREALQIANDDNRIRNVILRKWNCVYIKSDILEYYGHVHSPQTDPTHMHRSDCNWFGLSFNPGLLHLPTIRKLMPFREDMQAENRDWDKQSAKKYLDMGFKRANLKDNYVIHIGGGKTLYEG